MMQRIHTAWISIPQGVLLVVLLLTLLGLHPLPVQAANASVQRSLSVYRDPSCGCCEQWIEHMQAAGFVIENNIQTSEMSTVKQQLGVPTGLDSCHTAIANDYILEGHVPAADVNRLLAETPDILGIAVPGMPVGSPGMEMGETQDPYNVVAFDHTGMLSIFEQH